MAEREHAASLAAIEAMLREGQALVARRALEERLRHTPDEAEAWNLLGRASATLGDREAAARAFERCVELDPANDRAASNLAKLCADAGDLEAAAQVLEAARVRCPSSRRVLRALGVALHRLGRHGEALAPLEAALAAEPESALEALLVETLDEAADAAERARRFGLAEPLLRRLVELRPSEPSARRRLATLLCATRRVPEAMGVIDAAPAPDEPSLRSMRLYLRHLLPGWTRHEAREAHEAYGDHLGTDVRGARPVGGRSAERLRVGYYSRDFRAHAVAWFFLPIAERHDRSRVELVLISDAPRHDEVTEHLRSRADTWIDVVGLSNAEVQTRVLAAELDVFVDLGAHTAVSRLPCFAAKLAPVQLSYLGYPDRTGLASYDGRIVDELSDPPGCDESAREPLLRLGTCAWSFDPGVELNEPTRPQDRPVVFGCYNFVGKLSDDTLMAWARILAEVPESRLRLKSDAFDDPKARERISAELAALGIPSMRLDLAGRTPSRAAHLQSYADIDVALDSFPYNGTTTTCEALWMGAPVVALEGELHSSRVGASLLGAVGLGELVAASIDDYVQRAVALASDRARLARLQAELRSRMRASPLGDPAALCDELERLYEHLRYAPS